MLIENLDLRLNFIIEDYFKQLLNNPNDEQLSNFIDALLTIKFDDNEEQKNKYFDALQREFGFIIK